MHFVIIKYTNAYQQKQNSVVAAIRKWLSVPLVIKPEGTTTTKSCESSVQQQAMGSMARV
jgi:hypothetical protein